MAADLSRYLVIVLAAGLGKRLNPLTQILPKPVIPLLGEPLCLGMIRQLANHGARCIHLNVSYLSKTLENELHACIDNAYSNIKKTSEVGTLSSETRPVLRFWQEKTRLETGGAILHIWQRFRVENPEEANRILGVFVVSGDLVSEVPITQMLQTWESSRDTPEGRRPPQALVVTHKINGEKSTGVWTRENNTQIAGFWGDPGAATGAQDCEFAGFQIIDPSTLEGNGRDIRPGSVIDLVYRPILAKNGRILAVPLPQGNIWHNVGTSSEFFRCIRDLETRLGPGNSSQSLTTLGRRPRAPHWSGTCIEFSDDYTRLVNLNNVSLQPMETQPTVLAIHESEHETFEVCLSNFLAALGERLRGTELFLDAYSKPVQAPHEMQKDLHDHLIMQVFVCTNALIQLPRPILVGGRLFLEIALSQRYPHEASLDWLSLLIMPRQAEPPAYS